MTETDRNESNKSRQSTPDEGTSDQGRMVTEEEWSDLIEDAKRFKERHDNTFRRLSRGEG